MQNVQEISFRGSGYFRKLCKISMLEKYTCTILPTHFLSDNFLYLKGNMKLSIQGSEIFIWYKFLYKGDYNFDVTISRIRFSHSSFIDKDHCYTQRHSVLLECCLDYERVSARVTTRDYYTDVIMNMMAYLITSVSIVCSTVCSGTDQRKHQSSASRAFGTGIHWWPIDSPTKDQ